MSTAAEQYRKLVAKLEALQEAPVAAFNQNADNAAVGSVAADPAVAPEPAPAPTQDATQIPTIEAATFSQAYAKAKKQGLKKFKWCGVYAVKDAVPPKPVPPKPVPPTDTIPTTRTGVVAEPNDWKGRLQAGERNLI